MAKIQKNAIDELNMSVNITIEKSDYENAFNKQLKKYQKESNLKGFRKGKTPMGYVKKLFGKQLLADEVNRTLQEQMNEALQGVKFFGDPIPSQDQELVDFKPNQLEDYVFKFDLGLIPEFDVQGADKADTYNKYQAKLSDELLEESFLNARKRFGKRETIEDANIEIKDLVKVDAKELDGDAVKADGVEKSFSISMDMATEELQKEFFSKKKGDTVRFNVFDVEAKSDEKTIKKYVLGVEEDAEVNATFEAEIAEVSRVELAEMNEEFFNQAFGEGVVANEEEARERMRIDATKSYQSNADAMLFRQMQDILVEKNQFPVPEEFLKRWIKFSNENPVSDERIEREFPYFTDQLRWSIVRGKLIEKFDIKVTEEDIKQKFIDALKGYGMMGMGDDALAGFADRMMGDEKAVQEQAEQVLGDKLYDALTTAVTIEAQEVNEKELEEIIKAFNEKMQKENEEMKKAIEGETAEVEA